MRPRNSQKMPSTFLISLFTAVFVILAGGSGYTQTPPRDDQQHDVSSDEAIPLPEVPRQITAIKIENNLLSVELVNANFGETIQAIAQKAGFSIAGSSETFGSKVTTKFDNLEIDRGFARLFSLVKESNYLISYDEKGSISKLEVYGNISAGSVQKSPVARQMPPTRRIFRSPFPTAPRPVIRRLPRPVARPLPSEPSQPPEAPEPSPPAPPEPGLSDQMPEDENMAHEDIPDQDVKEIPYIPPQKKPVYIPPIRR